MIKALMITCVCGFALAVGSFGVLSITGIPHSHIADWDWSYDEHGPHKPTETATLDWSGSTELGLDIPGEVTYTQGPKISMIIHAPHKVLQAIELRDNTLRFRDIDEKKLKRSVRQDITVEISAPAVSRFDITSAVELKLKQLDVDKLVLNVSGAADISAEGKAHTLVYDGSGASNLDADPLAVKDATINLSGAGNVSAGPTEDVTVTIAGLGAVELLHTPRSLNKTIMGLGAITVGDGSGNSKTSAGIGGFVFHGDDHGHDHKENDHDATDDDSDNTL